MSQHDYPGGHGGHAGQMYGQQAPPPRRSSGLGIAALVLGLVGLALAWIPVIGIIGFICGLIGAVLGLVGVRKASNRGVTIAGIVLSIIAVVVSLMVWSALAAGTSAVGVGSPGLGGSAPVAPGSDEPRSEFAIGDTADLDGLQMTVGPLEKVRAQFGSGAHLCTRVAYVNQRDTEQPFNMYDWKLQTPEGTVLMPGLVDPQVDLAAGGVAAGGRATGRVCFDDPNLRGEYTVINEANSFTGTQVRWRGTF